MKRKSKAKLLAAVGALTATAVVLAMVEGGHGDTGNAKIAPRTQPTQVKSHQRRVLVLHGFDGAGGHFYTWTVNGRDEGVAFG